MDQGQRFEFWQEASRHDHDAWWNGPLHLIVLLLLIALLVVGIVLLVRQLTGRGAVAAAPVTNQAAAAATTAPDRADQAVATLRMRYARGEVGRDEFLQALGDLAAPAEPWPGGTVDESASTSS